MIKSLLTCLVGCMAQETTIEKDDATIRHEFDGLAWGINICGRSYDLIFFRETKRLKPDCK